jgi:hypothetical protein
MKIEIGSEVKVYELVLTYRWFVVAIEGEEVSVARYSHNGAIKEELTVKKDEIFEVVG